MRRWFISYNSQDVAIAERLETALKSKGDGSETFFAPKHLRAGGYWTPALAEAIEQSTAFVLLVGDKGLGPWQVIEYYEGLDRRVKSPDFPLVLMLLEGRSAPGLPFLRQLHWIITKDPASEISLGRLTEAALGHGTRPGELWRYTSPYRGLAAMTEADSDFLFGREKETVEVLEGLAQTPDRLAVLLGNSGVGKSSLAQAGIIAALKRQAWPERAAESHAWPASFDGSKGWCFLRCVPGTEPVRAVVEAFLQTWQLDPTRPLWAERRTEWVKALVDGTSSFSDLLDATERRYGELNQPEPTSFFIYIDQGEELYTRSEERQHARFSELIAEAIVDRRLIGLMSLRADFLGRLQNDAPLFQIFRQVNVPPMREAELLCVVSRPADVLAARFETDTLAADIARRTAEESVKDAGSLPLLSYLLDDMWTRMIERGDGILRLPPNAVELGGVLVERANAFLKRNPQTEDQLRRILTLKLATVRADSEPSRRRARLSEFSDEEWRIVSELAEHPHRLLVTGSTNAGDVYAEVAHEAIFRRWDKLKEWMAIEREFLLWKSSLETDRIEWEAAPEGLKADALLMGLALAQAQGWFHSRRDDLGAANRAFVEQSLERATYERRQRQIMRRKIAIGGAVALVVVTVLAGVAGFGFYHAAVEGLRATRLQAKYSVLNAAIEGAMPKFDRNVFGQPPTGNIAIVRTFVGSVIDNLKETAATLDSPDFQHRLEQGVGSKSILWVDPEPAHNVNEVEAFRKMGFFVEQVSTIPDALDRLQRRKIDLIITHFGNRPGGPEQSEAYQLMAKLKALDSYRAPVVIYSVLVNEVFACRAQKTGFYDETSKPAILLRVAIHSVEGDPATSRCKS